MLIAAVMICGCGNNKTAETEKGVTDIVIWHAFGGSYRDKFINAVAEFNRTHKDIRVHAVFTPNNTSNSQKFFTSVAAGKVPDISIVDGPQVVSWAAQGALLPLDDFMKEKNLTRSDFFEPAYDETVYKGSVYALHYGVDVNFLFTWNKKIFREVGLDPERPPKTLKELEEYDRKLRKIDPKTGEITRMGILPWSANIPPNAMFLWGYAFGGSFYDPATHTVTADDPKIVAALDWMGKIAESYDIKKIAAFTGGFGGYEQNPYYIGKLAMTWIGADLIKEIEKYAPNLDYGVAPWPAPEGGEYGAAWLGGWCFGLPKGCPHPKEAWEFLYWLCADPEGTKIVYDNQRVFPAVRGSKAFEEIAADDRYAIFYNVLKTCKHQRPVMPAQALLMGELYKAVDKVIYGQDTAENALKEVNKQVQTELDLRLAGE